MSMLFAAAHESVLGPNAKSGRASYWSAWRGRSDVVMLTPNRRE